MTAEKIPEKNISVVQSYTIGDIGRHFKDLDKAVKAYKKSFIDIALNLYWLDETGCSNHPDEHTHYRNISEFAFNRYGISKATTYQYIAVVKKFGKMNPETGFIDRLDDRYKDYSVTALITMSRMNDMQLLFCKPTMKISELKDICSGSRNETAGNETADNNKDASSKDEGTAPYVETDSSKADSESLPLIPKPQKDILKNSQKLFEIRDIENFEKHSGEIIKTIKRVLAQDNGKKYHVNILMTWD